MINFHAPFSVEDQLSLLGVYSGNYVLDFRTNLVESAALVNSLGSYIYEGVPLTKILSEYSSSYPQIYNNKIFPKTLIAANGTLNTHVWNKAAAQSIYSDLVIESSTAISAGNKTEVYVQVLNANYINIDENGNILSFSPLLQNQVNSWKNSNSGRNPKTKDFFGTDRVITYTYGVNPVGETGELNLTTEGVYAVDLENMKIDFGLEEVITYPEPPPPEEPVEPPPEDPENPEEPAEPEPPPEPIITYVPRKAPGGVSKLAIYADHPSIDNPVVGLRTSLTDLKKYTPTNSLVTLEALKIGETPNTFYQGLFKNIIQEFSTKYAFSKSSVGGYVKFLPSDLIPKLYLSGIYVGRSLSSSENDLRKHFLSFPESVVQETGVEVLFSYREVVNTDNSIPELSSLYTAPLLSVSAGPVAYQLFTSLWTLSYESESLTTTEDRYRIRYEISDEVTTDIYRFRWESTSETTEYTQIWNFTWDSENTRLYSSEYYIRFETELPEFREYKDFYSITWDNALVQAYTNNYKFAYEAEQFRSYTAEWSFSWQTSLIDSVIIKPYYLERYIEGEYIDCISYQIYADYQAIREYILTGKFYIYFSNAPKYEMVMFDVERFPYEDIFLQSIEDSSLEYRDDVPEKYIFLGNYTIKNINRNTSLSLDIVGGTKQLNEYRSYWLPEELVDYTESMIPMDDGYSSALPLDNIFVDLHNTDEVELEVVALEAGTCCFIQTSVGSRCSPY